MISFKTLLNNPYFLTKGETKSVYLYVELKAEEAQVQNKRLPLNLALVLDRSGSMEGDKIAYTKKAASFVINQLNSEDILSIVQYDDKIETLQSADYVKNKELLHKKVEQISARSMTNLSGGMLEGFAQVMKKKQEGYVNRVLLLSDGLANEGITDQQQLQLLAQKKFRESGVALSTFGVGADYDEKLMTNLAEYGGANYYFIETPDQIPGIFAKELSGLLQVVGQNAVFRVKFPKNYLNPAKVYGYPFAVQQDELIINFNDLYSKEEKAVLIRFDLAQNLDQNLQFTYDFTYDEVVKTMDRVTQKGELYLNLTEDTAIFEAAENTEVKEQIALFTANDEFENIMEMMDNRNFEAAKQKINHLLQEVSASMNETTSDKLKEQLHIISSYESRMDFIEQELERGITLGQKMSRSANYNSRKRK